MSKTAKFYEKKIEEMLGHYVYEINVTAADSKHPCIDVEYYDFKPLPVVRKMLEQAFPEVEFRKLSREYSNEMIANYLLNVLYYNTDYNRKPFKLFDCEKEEIFHFAGYVNNELYDMDLTDRSWIECDATQSAFATVQKSKYNRERSQERDGEQ